MSAALGNRGVRAALVAALLFGAGTPAAKLLLGEISPWMLAGLLYCGSGLGLGLVRLVRRSPRVRLSRGEWVPLSGAVVFGGVTAPVLLLVGLTQLSASGASLLLNAEGVCTALLAWFVFKENVDRRIAAGMVAIVAGALVISVPAGVQWGSLWPALAILGACLCWGLDNNLTRKVALNDATWLAAVKGSVAGPVNLSLAFVVGAAQLPAVGPVAAALVAGFFANGVSLVLFIVAMRYLGTARAGTYFSIAPFFGALLAVALGDTLTWPLALAGVLMAVGVWLHLSEDHRHTHRHERLTHTHAHLRDDHHRHHREAVQAGARHTHEHTHEPIEHAHPHYPDAHHRHRH